MIITTLCFTGWVESGGFGWGNKGLVENMNNSETCSLKCRLFQLWDAWRTWFLVRKREGVVSKRE